MDPIQVKGTLQEKTSKNGNKYLCLEVRLTENYTKVVFFEKAEEELLKLSLSKNIQDNTK